MARLADTCIDDLDHIPGSQTVISCQLLTKFNMGDAMASEHDLYEVLGVPRDADDKAIKSAYRKLAMKCHPDRNKAPDAEEKFRELANAYAILHDPKKRQMYDAGGHAGIAGFSPEDLYGGIDFEDIFGGLGFGFGGGAFSDLFRRHVGPRHGANIMAEVVVPLETILTGGKEIVRAAHPVTCPDCGGTGAKKGTKPRPCEDCNGTGRQVKTEQRGNVRFQQATTCQKCHGLGQFIDTPCHTCDGRGQVHKEETLSVTIPPGADDGLVLRISGHGLPAPETGAKPGDLLVAIRTAPDSRFERHGANLWRIENASIADAVLGAETTVPTLEGGVKVHIPPGTQPGSVLRIGGKGLPIAGRSSRGDILLRIDVDIPTKLGNKERSLYEQLRELTPKKE